MRARVRTCCVVGSCQVCQARAHLEDDGVPGLDGEGGDLHGGLVEAEAAPQAKRVSKWQPRYETTIDIEGTESCRSAPFRASACAFLYVFAVGFDMCLAPESRFAKSTIAVVVWGGGTRLRPGLKDDADDAQRARLAVKLQP